MKLKKIRVPVFVNNDAFGSFKSREVEILFDPSENDITPDNFDQETHSYFLGDDEIDRITRESAQFFFNENGAALLKGDQKFKKKQINAVKDFFKITASDLGELIGMDKSSISRILSGKQELQRDKTMLVLERLQSELEHPGKVKIILSHLRDEASSLENFDSLCFSALKVAEFFVRRFFESDGPITNLKLQKLLYYAQGVGFGRSNIKLMQEPLLAWEHGPVVREVYNKFKVLGKNVPLPTNDSMDITEITKNDLVMAVLDETISLYGVYDAWFLADKTHLEAPWLETPRDEVITDERMIRFFKKVLV